MSCVPTLTVLGQANIHNTGKQMNKQAKPCHSSLTHSLHDAQLLKSDHRHSRSDNTWTIETVGVITRRIDCVVD